MPCYVNSRLSSQGIPVACEVDIYGALSEYLCYLASDIPATLLDINNTVPDDMVGGDQRPEGRDAPRTCSWASTAATPRAAA